MKFFTVQHTKDIRQEGSPSTTFARQASQQNSPWWQRGDGSNHNSLRSKSGAGFTLIEMIVAAGLFAIIVTAAVGALVTIVDANRRTRSMQLVMDNLNFAVEEMSREIRVGTGYRLRSAGANCNRDVARPWFEFTDSGGNVVSYKCINHQLFKSVDGGGESALSDPAINIDRMYLNLTGTTNGDTKQPQLFMTISGTASVDAQDPTPFKVQTLITQRILD